MSQVEILYSLNEKQKDEAISILYDAFELKMKHLYVFQENEEQGKRILREAIQFDQGIYAVLDGKVIGVAGLETSNGKNFEEFNLQMLQREFSLTGAIFRWLALGIFKHYQGNLDADTLHLDYLVTSAESRGKGVGTMLIDEAKSIAKKRNLAYVMLEVVNTNPRAERLYTREGFQVVEDKTFGVFTTFTKRANFTSARVMEYLIP